MEIKSLALLVSDGCGLSTTDWTYSLVYGINAQHPSSSANGRLRSCWRNSECFLRGRPGLVFNTACSQRKPCCDLQFRLMLDRSDSVHILMGEA